MYGSPGVALDGARVRSLRRNQAFTQVTLAERAELTMRTVRQAEKGKPISLRTWRKIAEALGVEPSEMLPEGVEA